MLLPLLIVLGQLDGGTPEAPAELTEAEIQTIEESCGHGQGGCEYIPEIKRIRAARRTAEYEAALAAEEAANAALRKKCGRDYMRVRVGARWSRVSECAGPFDLRYRDGAAAVYEAAGGMVRVEQGRVTRIIYR